MLGGPWLASNEPEEWFCVSDVAPARLVLNGVFLLTEKYEYVGRLLKPGEEPSEYTDEEDIRDHSKQE